MEAGKNPLYVMPKTLVDVAPPGGRDRIIAVVDAWSKGITIHDSEVGMPVTLEDAEKLAILILEMVKEKRAKAETHGAR